MVTFCSLTLFLSYCKEAEASLWVNRIDCRNCLSKFDACNVIQKYFFMKYRGCWISFITDVFSFLNVPYLWIVKSKCNFLHFHFLSSKQGHVDGIKPPLHHFLVASKNWKMLPSKDAFQGHQGVSESKVRFTSCLMRYLHLIDFWR